MKMVIEVNINFSFSMSLSSRLIAVNACNFIQPFKTLFLREVLMNSLLTFL